MHADRTVDLRRAAHESAAALRVRDGGAPSTDMRGTPPRPPAGGLLNRIGRSIWRPSPAAMRGAALAAIIANVLIVESGEAVRLTESGLGCPTWPHCFGNSLIPVPDTLTSGFHMFVEFSNRMITFVVLATVAVCLWVAWRQRQRRKVLVAISLSLVGGVVLQAVLGGITVLVDLNPAAVASHFIVSMALIAASVALHYRAAEGDGPRELVVRREVRWLAIAVVGVVLLQLAAGTVVTGSGPHAGAASSPRFPFGVEATAQLHADIGWIMVVLAFALGFALYLTKAPRLLIRRTLWMFGLMAVQGIVGYVQYFLAVPPPLVAVHVVLACLVWIAAVRLMFSTRLRTDPNLVPATVEPAAASTSA